MRNGLKITCGAIWVTAVLLGGPVVQASVLSFDWGTGPSLPTAGTGQHALDWRPDTVEVIGNLALIGYRVATPLAAGETGNDLNVHAEFAAESTPVVEAGWVPTGEGYADLDTHLPRPGLQPVEVLGVIEQRGQRWLEVVVYPRVVQSDGRAAQVERLTVRLGERALAATEFRAAADLSRERVGRAPLAASDLGDGGWVVVTSEALAPAFSELVAHRRALGFDAQVVTIDTILGAYSGEDDAARLKSFCRGFYDGGGEYVLLAGDETVLPVRYAFPYDVDETPDPQYFQLCDLYFADLDGNWDADGDGIYGERLDDEANLLPEIRVGRLPINSLWEAENYVENLIVYETNPGHGESDYLTRSFFFSSDQMRDYSGGGQHGRIAEAFPEHILIDTVNGLELSTGEDPDPTNQIAPELTDLMREGWGTINVLAHGRSDAFAVRTSGFNNWPKSYMMSEPLGAGHGEVSDMAGCGRTGFMYSLACDNGAFDKDQPPFNLPGRNLAQDLLTIEDGGVIGMVAYSRWGWVATSHYLQRHFFDSLFAHPHRPAVDAMYGSQQAYPYCRDLVMGQLYLGDPAIRVYTEQPRHLIGDVTIIEGRFRARFTDRQGVPVVNATAVLSDSSDILQSLTTDLEGWIVLPADLGLGKTYYLATREEGSTAAVFSFVPGLVTDVPDEPVLRPEQFALHQNYPNPFNPTTTISFELDRRAHAELLVYNMLGQRVATLVNKEVSAGRFEVVWDGSSDDGTPVSSGVYVYCLQSEAQVSSRKMILLR